MPKEMRMKNNFCFSLVCYLWYS